MRRQNRAGYTIVEVMIFLAVTGGLFIIAFTAFNGQQQKTQFQQAVRGMETQFQDWVNDVNVGNYSSNNISCTNPGVNTPPTVNVAPAGPPTQGSNVQCIFVGKVIRFINDKSIVVDTLAGNRMTTTGREVESIAEAKPVVVPSFSETFQNTYGVPIRRVFAGNNTQLGAFVIATTFGKASGMGNDLVSGSVSSRVIPVAGSVGEPDANYQTSINDANTLSNTPTQPITICIEGEYNSNWALIVIGAASGKLSVTSLITSAPPVGCTS